MRILITGADGYIGSACVREFSRQGWDVVAATRRPMTNQLREVVENIHGLSLTDEVDWASCLSKVDVVLHLAAVVHRHDASVAEYRSVNIDSTERLALEAAKAGVSRFLFLSSISVYGRHVGTKQINENTPLAPDDAYGDSKANAEALIESIASGTNMSWSVIRPPLVYGPNAPGNFHRLVNLIKTGMPLPLAAAKKSRSYIGIDNLVSAIVWVSTDLRAKNQCYVVSDEKGISTAEMILLIAQALRRPVRLWWLPEIVIRTSAALFGRSADVSKLFDPLHLDSSKIRSQLEWEALIPIEEGLRRAVKA